MGERGEQVRDVVPGVPVQAGPQPLLVEEVGNETDASAEHEQTVENTHLKVVLGLFGRKGTAVAEEINEADSNASVHVENEVVLLGRRHRLNGEGVVEQFGAREVLLNVLLDELDTEIRVVSGLDPVANTGD